MSPRYSPDHQNEADLTAESSLTTQPRLNNFATAGSSSPPYISPYPLITETQAGRSAIPVLRSQHTPPRPSVKLNPELRDLSFTDDPGQASMSTYSSSSASSSHYDSPNPQRYRGTIARMSSPKPVSTVCAIAPSKHDPGIDVAAVYSERETGIDSLIANASGQYIDGTPSYRKDIRHSQFSRGHRAND